MTSDLPKPPLGAPCNACGLCCRLQVCGAGSFFLGLVEKFGERAPGPCPALVSAPDGQQVCGVMLRPRDTMQARGSADDLRRAFGLLIGAGVGCDEPGEAVSRDDDAAARAMGEAYISRIGQDALARSAIFLASATGKQL